jgi:hypothetical protein
LDRVHSRLGRDEIKETPFQVDVYLAQVRQDSELLEERVLRLRRKLGERVYDEEEEEALT